MRKIAVTAELADKLARIFKVTPRTIANALQYRAAQNPLHERICAAAIENGGIDMTTVPSCECMHDAAGKMIQLYPNGAVLVADKTTGEVQVKDRKGLLVAERSNVSLRELSALQNMARHL